MIELLVLYLYSGLGASNQGGGKPGPYPIRRGVVFPIVRVGAGLAPALVIGHR